MVSVSDRFGRLVVLSNLGVTGSSRAYRWLCRCDCGQTTVVPTAKLNNGHTKSCGCLSRDKARALMTTHGMKDTAEYKVWKGIKRRCYNTREKCYKHYGGRGIVMSDDWKDSFESFYRDMGPRPYPKAQIDRIDNHGPYSKDNCRWTDIKTQANNRRDNVLFAHAGKSMTLAEWSRLTGIKYGTLRRRYMAGWPVSAIVDPAVKVSRWWR